MRWCCCAAISRDPLSEALYARWLEQQPEAGCVIDIPAFWEEAGQAIVLEPVQWHRARDLEDQAARAAACVPRRGTAQRAGGAGGQRPRLDAPYPAPSWRHST